MLSTLRMRPDTRLLISSFDRPNIHYSVEFVDLMTVRACGSVWWCSVHTVTMSMHYMEVAAHPSISIYVTVTTTTSPTQESDDVQKAAFRRTLHHVRRAIKDAKGHACCIVYTHKRITAAVFAQFLLTVGLRAAPYHAGLAKNHRTDVLQRWIAGELDVVAATIAFGMGLDKANVRLVVHLNIPKSVEGLYQVRIAGARNHVVYVFGCFCCIVAQFVVVMHGCMLPGMLSAA